MAASMALTYWPASMKWFMAASSCLCSTSQLPHSCSNVTTSRGNIRRDSSTALLHPSAYVSIRQRTSEIENVNETSVAIAPPPSCIRQRMSASVRDRECTAPPPSCIRQHISAARPVGVPLRYMPRARALPYQASLSGLKLLVYEA